MENTIEVFGANIPTEYKKLTLNGYAIRSFGGEPLYIGVLYTQSRNNSDQSLLINDAPMAMAFYFISDDITPEIINQVFMESIVVNTPRWHNAQLTKVRLEELQKYLNHTFNAGDILIIEYFPENGMEMYINNQLQNKWTHAKSFFNIILSMWIGPYPSSREFKKSILNAD